MLDEQDEFPEKVYAVTIDQDKLKMSKKQICNLAIECLSHDMEEDQQVIRLYFVKKKDAETFVCFVFDQEKMIRSKKK